LGITNDYYGNPRPTNGNFTIGPFEGGTAAADEAGGITVAANFTGTPLRGLAPLTVTFTDASTGSPTEWAWDFANDAAWTTTNQNPVFTYTNAGTYSVKLTVNGTNTLMRASYVTATNAPAAPDPAAPATVGPVTTRSITCKTLIIK
jgi:PKD repeat protein